MAITTAKRNLFTKWSIHSKLDQDNHSKNAHLWVRTSAKLIGNKTAISLIFTCFIFAIR